jgi:hypothetical protein
MSFEGGADIEGLTQSASAQLTPTLSTRHKP